MQNDKHRGSLGSKFENFGAAPSEGLWDSIADNLDEKKKRRGIIWWFTGAGIAAIGLLAVLIYNGQPTSDQHSGTINEIKESDMTVPTDLFTQEIPKENRESLPNRFDENRQDESVLNNEQFEENNVNERSVNDRNALGNNEENLTDRAPNRAEENVDQVWVVEEKIDLNKIPLSDVSKIDAEETEWGEELSGLSPIETPKRRKNKWEFGAEFGSWGTLPNLGTTSYDFAPTWVDDEMIDTGTFSLEDASIVASNPKVRVNRLVELGFHVGYRLTDRWRLTSGVDLASNRYSYVKSQYASVNAFSSFPFYPKPARIFTASVPVNVEYDFLKRNRFRMGAGIGVLNEFSIMERYQPYYDANYTGEKSFINTAISGYSFAVNTQLSASYYLTEFMRIRGTLGTRIYTRQKVNSTLQIPNRNFWGGGSLGVVWELH